MKAIHLTVVLLVVAFTGVQLKAQERETPPVSLQKIADGVYQVNGGQGSNSGVIVGENDVIVIDAKMNEASVDQTIVAIRNETDKPIRYLVNTHSDGDHIMGDRYFPAPVTFIAQENCRADFFKEDFGRETRPRLIHSNKGGNSFQHVLTLRKLLKLKLEASQL